MQVSVEQTSELSRKMTVSFSEEVVQKKVAERIKSLAREVSIHGFRPGKVPQHIVEKMYGDKVREEIYSDLIQSSYVDALNEQSLRAAGYPHIEPLNDENGFSYIATFEVYPDIIIEGLDQLEVTRPVATVNEEDVDAIIEKLREQQKDWLVVERPSQQGDSVIIHFSGTAEGENFTNGTVSDYMVEIGANKMIPGFENELIGLQANDKKNFEITFPENYSSEKLAGKLAQFDIEVVAVEESVLPEINEEFIQKYGVEDGTMESFRHDVKENLTRELKHVLNGKLKTAIMDALYARFSMTIPNALINEEIQNLMKPYIESAKRQKVKLEDLELPREQFEEQAKRRVTLGLLLGEIIEKHTITLDDAKVREAIEDMAKSYESPEDVIKWYYAEEKRLHDVRQMVLEDQVVTWLVDQAKVTDKTVSFNDVMDKQQA